MNLLLPSAPAGAHGPAGAGDGPASKRDIPDGDFAAALAETAGDGGDEAKGREARTEKPDDAARLLRAARRLDAREMRARQHGEVPTPRATLAKEPDAEPRLKVARRAEGKDEVRKAGSGKVVEDAPAAPRPETVTPDTAVREVLAVLGVDLAARSERAAAGAEGGASMRMAAGARNIDMDARRAGVPGEPELGDEETEVLPVRVVRQEKHFQPSGVEAQRWQGVLSLREDARVSTVPQDDAKAAQPEVALRDRPMPPTAQARAVEVATPVAQPMSATGDVMPGAVGIQIADRVQQALGTPAAESSAPTPPAGASHDPDTRQVFAPAIRTIKLQLNPASLGAVTIVLSGNDNGISIQLAAELPDTVTQVENDRGVLAARLNGAGYAVTDVSVARLGAQGMDSDARDAGARQGGTQEQFAGSASRDGGTQFGGQSSGRGFGGHRTHADAGPAASRGAAGAPTIPGVSYAGRFRPV